MNELSAIAATAQHREMWGREHADPARRHRRRAIAVWRAERRRRP